VSRVTIPAGFEWIRDGRVQTLVRADVRSWLLPLLGAARRQWEGYTTRPLAGGRGGARIVPAHGVVVRPYRRGGLPGRLLHDTYFGWSPRPFRELSVTSVLHERGAPVVEVYGAAVEWLVPGCYRGWLATRYLEGARTFWEWLSTAPPTAERDTTLRAIGRALRRLHACGARHPDLNANNILLFGMMDVAFIDFDRARITGDKAAGGADLDRLWRSLNKLDPESRYVTAANFELLRAAYREGPACA
jgi:tRNA A-37 threonylcarbamoyl transferase component Bud32